MCLIIFKYQPTEHYKLVLLANRDEYHQRGALKADYWSQQPNTFGGIDKLAGGSWLSVDTSGRLAVVTNVRKPPFINNKQSRGHIVSNFLSSRYCALEFLNKLKTRDEDYGLFNLLLMDNTGLWYFSNDSHQIQRVTAGIHGLSNASLDTPWPKLTASKARIKESLDTNKVNHLQLLNTMQSQIKPLDEELPSTGVGLKCERLLSSTFILGDNYGTRCTTLITINHDAIIFIELSYASDGQIKGEVNKKIAII